jgi:hypothetical protein
LALAGICLYSRRIWLGMNLHIASRIPDDVEGDRSVRTLRWKVMHSRGCGSSVGQFRVFEAKPAPGSAPTRCKVLHPSLIEILIPNKMLALLFAALVQDVG